MRTIIVIKNEECPEGGGHRYQRVESLIFGVYFRCVKCKNKVPK